MEEIAAFIRRQPTAEFKKDEIMIYQGEQPGSLFGIRSGFVKIHDIGSDGNEQLIWLAKKYDVLPIEWLFDEEKTSNYFYTAHTDVSAFVVEKQAFINEAKENPKVLLAIIKAITAKYNDLLHHVNAAQKPKARDKIIYTLYFIASRFTSDEYSGLQEVTLPLTHQDLANLTGTTRETASLELKKLKDEGVIQYDKTSFFIHVDKLAEVII